MVPLGWIGGVVGLILATSIFCTHMLLLPSFMSSVERGISDTGTLQVLYTAFYVLFHGDNSMKLPYAIAIAGLARALFPMDIPHLSALRIWMAISTFFSLVYIIIGFALALKDGNSCTLRWPHSWKVEA